MWHLILNIETATKVCSVSLASDGETIATKELNDENYSHSENLNLFIEHTLKVGDKTIRDLDAIAISRGPGSYTGLRIGVSTAKGLAYGLGLPIIAVDTLQAMANGFLLKHNIEDEHFLIAPMIDARRMEVYNAIYDPKLNEVKKVSADIIDESIYADTLKKHKVFFCGDGSQKCIPLLEGHQNANFVDDINASSGAMITLSEQLYLEKQFVDTAYFEPYYLKDFIATTPKKLV